MYHFFIHIIGWRLSVSINDMLCYMLLYCKVPLQQFDCDSVTLIMFIHSFFHPFIHSIVLCLEHIAVFERL